MNCTGNKPDDKVEVETEVEVVRGNTDTSLAAIRINGIAIRPVLPNERRDVRVIIAKVKFNTCKGKNADNKADFEAEEEEEEEDEEDEERMMSKHSRRSVNSQTTPPTLSLICRFLWFVVVVSVEVEK
jgi:hypothetical protein